MEFKRKLLKMRKQNRQRRLKARGMVRVEVRGRKRWVKPEKSKSGPAA